MDELIIFAMGIVVCFLIGSIVQEHKQKSGYSGSIVIVEYDDQPPEMYLEIGVPYEEFKKNKEVSLKVVHKHFYSKPNNRKKMTDFNDEK